MDAPEERREVATRPYPREDHRVGPTVLSGWGGGRKRTAPKEVLFLREIIVLRRLRAGETQAEAARSLGWSKSTVTGLLRHARVRLGVDTVAQLLDLSVVLKQLDGES